MPTDFPLANVTGANEDEWIARVHGIAFGSLDGFTDVERAAIRWQFRSKGTAGCVALGAFENALWTCLEAADTGNRQRLALGFPVEAEAYGSWTTIPGWADALREKSGLD